MESLVIAPRRSTHGGALCEGCWSIQNHEWQYLFILKGLERTEPDLYYRPDDPYDQQSVLAEHPGLGDALDLELRRCVDRVAQG